MKKVLFTAGIGATDRPDRWTFILHLWERLAETFELLGVETKIIHHPCLTPVGDHPIPVDMKGACDIMEAWGPDFLFIWNGGTPEDRLIIDHAEAWCITTIFSELGWFPQRETLYFDRLGVNAASSLSVPVHHAITEDQGDELQDYRRRFLRGKPDPTEQWQLICLQVEDDTNIINGKFDSMQEFVTKARREIGNDHVLIRRHPKDPDVKVKNDPPMNPAFFWDKNEIYHSIMGAKCVHACNSTVLLEAAMLGKRIRAYDRGIIHPDIEDMDALLYQLIKRQLKWGDVSRVKIIRDYPIFSEIFD